MEKNLKKDINEALMVLGVQPHLKGFNYLGYALYEILDGKISDYKMIGHGGLYEHIAKEFDTTQSRVERAIRHAVEVAMLNLGAALIYELFGNTLSTEKDKPCNSHYIAAVVNMLKYEPERLRR